MISMNRIKLMTALALYEEGEGKNEIRISNYKKNDYVGLHMLTTAILATIGYLLILAIVGAMLFMTISKSLTDINFVFYLIIIVVTYVVFVTFWVIYAYKKFGNKHRTAKEHAKNYFVGLRRLDQLYRLEKRQAMQRMKQSQNLSDLKEQLGGEK